MIASSKITDRTGISARTLRRWQTQAIIPEPEVRTHPSGRGKIGYYPEWVLRWCELIVERRKAGVSPAESGRLLEAALAVDAIPDPSMVLEDAAAQLAETGEKEAVAVIATLTGAVLAQAGTNAGAAELVIGELERGGAELALKLARSGFNPVLIFDGSSATVMADFQVSLHLQARAADPTPLVFLSLFPVVSRAGRIAGNDLPPRPTVSAAPKVWAQGDDDQVHEYTLSPGGSTGFSLIQESSTSVGRLYSPVRWGEGR